MTNVDYNVLRAEAKAKRDKAKSPQWKSIDKRTIVSNFLNSGKSGEQVFVTGKTAAYIVTGLNKVITEDGLNELCYAVETNGEAHLCSFVEDEPVAEDN